MARSSANRLMGIGTVVLLIACVVVYAVKWGLPPIRLPLMTGSPRAAPAPARDAEGALIPLKLGRTFDVQPSGVATKPAASVSEEPPARGAGRGRDPDAGEKEIYAALRAEMRKVEEAEKKGLTKKIKAQIRQKGTWEALGRVCDRFRISEPEAHAIYDRGQAEQWPDVWP